MNIFLVILSILILSYILVAAGKRLKIPSVVMLILLGILYGSTGLRDAIAANEQTLLLLGDIGVICLMFIAGLESSWSELFEEKKDAAIIAAYSDIFSFIFGFAGFLILGYPITTAIIVGICLSITAEGTTARILLEINKIKTRVGAAILGSGLIDDVLGIFIFMIAAYAFHQVQLTQYILLLLIVVAFFIGVFAQSLLGRSHKLVHKAEKAANILIIPFFFIAMGYHFDLGALLLSPWLGIFIILIAISGKLLGVLSTKRFINFSWKQLYLIGWAMNSRGALELALAVIAFRAGIFGSEVLSGLVVTALITTLIFPLVLNSIIKKDPQVMNRIPKQKPKKA